MRVLCDLEEIDDFEYDNGGEGPGTRATCSRCGHCTEVAGQSEESELAAMAMLRDECPKRESNFYDEEIVVKKKTKSKSSSKSSSSKKSGGSAVNFDKYLKGLNRHLDKAKETASSGGGFEEFDDGKYRMRAVDAKVGVSKNKRVQVIITWKFMDGDYKGKEKLDFEGLTEDHLPYLLRKLEAMGYDTTELESLEDELKQILDDIKKTKPKCKVRLKTKGEFQNVYVDGVLSDDEEEEEDEDEEDDEEEEVEDEVDVVVGSIVKATSKKEGKVKGEVVELFESEGKVLIKTDKGKTLKLKADQITSVEESPAKSVPKKGKKSKK
jgi:hypothetical protein